MDYLRGRPWKCKCWEEMRTRATERIIEAIDPVLHGQFECERLNTETKGFSLGEPTLLPTPLPDCYPSAFIHVGPECFRFPRSSSARRCRVQCWRREQRRWPLSCERGAPQQLALIMPNCPAGRITSCAWCSKVTLIPLGQASLTLGDFFPVFLLVNPHNTLSSLFFFLFIWGQNIGCVRKTKQCRGHAVLGRNSSEGWIHQTAPRVPLLTNIIGRTFSFPFLSCSSSLCENACFCSVLFFFFPHVPSPIFKLLTAEWQICTILTRCLLMVFCG